MVPEQITSDLLNKLIEFKTISDNLNSIQKKFIKSVKNVLNLDLINNSVTDCIKDSKIIQFKQNSNKLKCFWPNYHFTTTRGKQKLKIHQMIHKNIKLFECKKCNKNLRLKDELIRHQLIHKNIKP